MSFNSLSHMFEECLFFKGEEEEEEVSPRLHSAFCMQSDAAQFDQHTFSDSPDLLTSPRDVAWTPHQEPIYYLQSARAALLREDFAAVEDSIHNFFDCGPRSLDWVFCPPFQGRCII